MRFRVTHAPLAQNLRHFFNLQRPRALALSAYSRREPFFYTSRSLAHIRPDGDALVSLAFAQSEGRAQESELGRRPDTPRPDERTLKLGKSMSQSVEHARQTMWAFCGQERLTLSQLCAYYSPGCPTFWQVHYHKRSFLRAYRSISFRRHIPICLRCPGGLHTMPLFGLHQ